LKEQTKHQSSKQGQKGTKTAVRAWLLHSLRP